MSIVKESALTQSNDGISRRTLFKGAAGAAAAVALAPGVKGSVSAQGSGTLTIAQGLDPRGLNPLDGTAAQEHNVSTQIVQKLLMYNPEGVVIPYLAESWEQLDDTTLQIKLRDGVAFTNGEPFDAEAAKFSIGLLMEATSYSRYTTDFDSVEVVDPLTFNLISKGPSAAILATVARGSWMLPPAYYQEVGPDEFAQKPIGTGPFKLKEWVKDDHVTLEANPDYWEGAPGVQEVIFRPLPEPASRVAALEAGDVDIIIDLSLPDVERVDGTDGISASTVDGMRLMSLTMAKIQEGPFEDVRVRQAICYGLDVPTIIEAVFAGRALQLQGQLATPAYFGYTDQITAYPFDPEKGKALLAEAGYPDGFDFDFQYTSGRYAQDKEVGEIIAQELEANLGIRANQMVLESGDFLDQLTALTLGPMFYSGSLTIPELYFQLSTDLCEGASYSYFCNEEYDATLRKAVTTVDDEARLALYADTSKIAHEDPPRAWLFAPQDAYGVRDRVVDFAPRPDQWLDLRKVSVSE